MNGSSEEDRDVPQHIAQAGGNTLRDWRLKQLEDAVKELRGAIDGEKNWRFLVTGGISVGAAVISYMVAMWRSVTGQHP